MGVETAERDQRRARPLPPDFERAVLRAVSERSPIICGIAKGSASATARRKYRCRAASGFSGSPRDRRSTSSIATRCPIRCSRGCPVSESLYFEFYAGHFFRELSERLPRIAPRGAEPPGRSAASRLLRQAAERDRRPDFQLGPCARHLGSEFRPLPPDPRARDRAAAGFVSVPADNERFSTDVGVRNTRGDGALIASGAREGYLQMGPNIPSEGRPFQGPLDRHDTGGTRRAVGRR